MSEIIGTDYETTKHHRSVYFTRQVPIGVKLLGDSRHRGVPASHEPCSISHTAAWRITAIARKRLFSWIRHVTQLRPLILIRTGRPLRMWQQLWPQFAWLDLCQRKNRNLLGFEVHGQFEPVS